MGTFKEVEGCLIQKALAGEFDVIAQGCNAFCTMSAGIAVPMKQAFKTNEFYWETQGYGDINKLGVIDYRYFDVFEGEAIHVLRDNGIEPRLNGKLLTVVNCYTQYKYGRNHADGDKAPFDYDAFRLCMRKINHIFKGKHIGLPFIGAGLGGGHPDLIKGIMKEIFKACNVTLVHYKP